MRNRDRVSLYAALSALALAVLAIGGVPRWSIGALAILAITGVANQLRSRRRMGRVSALFVLLGSALVLTALQLLPLPDGLLASLMPTLHSLRLDAAALLGEGGASVATLSLDPATTRYELAKCCVYVLLAWNVLRIAVSEEGRLRLLSAVAGIAAVTALAGVVHYLLGATSLFGIYDPVHSHPRVLAPLLNPNHLASLMTMGAIVAGGLALHERRSPSLRVMWMVVCALCIGVELATRSRGGTLALAAGATVTIVIIILQRLGTAYRKTRGDTLRIAIPGAVVLMCSLILVVYFGGAEVRDELAETQLSELEDARSKYAAWSSAWFLVDEAPYFGVGRGAFETAFTRVHPAAGSVTFSHLENEYLQVIVDWGIAGAIVLGGAVLFALYALRRRWAKGPLAAAAIGALAALGVHSFVDFGLSLPGIALPAIFIAATLFYVPLDETSPSRRRTLGRMTIAIALVTGGLQVLLPGARTLGEDHDDLRTSTLAEAREALARHPLDYAAAARIAQLAKDPAERIRFLNFALRLHPRHPGLHRAAARLLLATKRTDQAALEMRLALLGTAKPEPFVADVVVMFPDRTVAISALPAEHPQFAQITTTLIGLRRDDLALAYLWKVIEKERPHDGHALRRALSLANLRKDSQQALRAARALFKLEPTAETAILLAKLQLAAKDYAAVLATLGPLATQTVTSPDHVTARSLVCDTHIERTDWPAAKECLTTLLLGAGVTLAMRRTVHARMATVEEALGNPERARLERELSRAR